MAVPKLSSVPPDLRPVKTAAPKPPKAPPKPKPTVTKGAVKPKPKTGMAGLYGGIGPNAYVNNIYAPQEQAAAAQQAQRQAAYMSLLKQFTDSLQGVSSQLQPYTNAASQQGADANAAAASLAAANPNAVTQNDLRAIGAPQAQQDAVTAQNNTAFPGNAALLRYTGGVIPSDQFKSDAAARATFLNTLPLQGESLGIRGLNQLNSLASSENLKLSTAKAGDLLKARSDLGDFVQKNQAAKAKFASDQAKAAAAAAKAAAPSSSLSRTLGYLVDSNGNPVLRGGKIAVLPGYTVGRNGQVVKIQKTSGKGGASGSKYAVSSTLSKQTGFWTDSHGNIVFGADGKPIKWNNAKGAKPAFSAKDAAKFNGNLQKGYQSMPAGTTYLQFLQESVSQKVPLGYAISFANRHWPPTQRATGEDIAGIAGATPQNVDASGYPGQVAAVNQAAGRIPNLVPLARKYNLDAKAVFAVAAQEGLGGGVGDNGTSFGPFQLHVGGALPSAIAIRGAKYAHAWAWSPAGIEYALSRMGKVAGGLTGQAAINAIVSRFERPANIPNEIAGATAYYGRM